MLLERRGKALLFVTGEPNRIIWLLLAYSMYDMKIILTKYIVYFLWRQVNLIIIHCTMVKRYVLVQLQKRDHIRDAMILSGHTAYLLFWLPFPAAIILYCSKKKVQLYRLLYHSFSYYMTCQDKSLVSILESVL